MLFSSIIPTFFPFLSASEYMYYQGCYFDNPGDPDLVYADEEYHSKFHPDWCVEFCKDKDYEFASVQMVNVPSVSWSF